MILRSIDHIELCVEDARRSALFYSSCLGFRVMAESRPEAAVEGARSYLLQQGTLRLVLTSASGGPVAAYVERHGDGVKDIAFLTVDAVAAFEEAVERGARPVSEPTVLEGEGARVIRATVAAPMGDLTHTLVQREGQQGVFMPGRFQETNNFAPPVIEPFVALDHVAICLERGTLVPVVRSYGEIFGFHESHDESVRSDYSGMKSKVVQSPGGRIVFPMMEPIPGARRMGQIEEFLGLHGGPGVQHLAMLSQDIAASIRQMKTRQIEFLDIPGAYYDLLERRVGRIDTGLPVLRELGILADKDADGVLLQVFARSTHPRRTLFFEVIQRLNSSGFGAGNIRALYEAKEFEQSRRTPV